MKTTQSLRQLAHAMAEAESRSLKIYQEVCSPDFDPKYALSNARRLVIVLEKCAKPGKQTIKIK